MKFEENSNLGTIITGVVNFNILAVNPTLEQLKEIGVNFNKEPEYQSVSDAGNKKVRIDFWLKPTIQGVGLIKHSLFLEDVERKSQGGKTQFINSKCESSYADSIDSLPDWMEKKGARPCKSGEDLLMLFLKKFANVATLEFDNFNALFNNNVSEIRDLLKVKKSNQIQLLCGEKNGYQAIYTKYCMSGNNTKMTYWENHLRKEAGNIKIDYQDSIEPKPWVNKAPEVEEDSAPSLFS